MSISRTVVAVVSAAVVAVTFTLVGAASAVAAPTNPAASQVSCGGDANVAVSGGTVRGVGRITCSKDGVTVSATASLYADGHYVGSGSDFCSSTRVCQAETQSVRMRFGTVYCAKVQGSYATRSGGGPVGQDSNRPCVIGG